MKNAYDPDQIACYNCQQYHGSASLSSSREDRHWDKRAAAYVRKLLRVAGPADEVLGRAANVPPGRGLLAAAQGLLRQL